MQAWCLATLVLFISCSEAPNNSNKNSQTQIEDSQQYTSDNLDAAVEPPDPCLTVLPQDGLAWCSCFPQCCQTQEWFCQPEFGSPTYQKKQIIVNFCGDAGTEPCYYGLEANCNPPQILYEGECEDAYECPPMAQSLDYGWQYCEMPDGTIGKQSVVCDKGKLFFSECQHCTEEICDGKDNDCDGLIDEDIPVSPCENDCGPGNEICENGSLVCYGPSPQEEICDYIDNDCDDEIDEGQRNACNECGAVPAEICDGIDNDCNGIVDDELIVECTTACGVGVEVCVMGTWSVCTAKQPTDEICNGFDDDCNGLIDDGIDCLCTLQDVGKLMPCFEPPLLCGQGYKTCLCSDPSCAEIVVSPCYAACHWLIDPPGSDPNCDSLVGIPLNEEKCNNFDDNCNLLVDEGLITDCYTGPDGTLGVGICEAGNMTCDSGQWGSYSPSGTFIENMCADQIVPSVEECNGIDDDCDGQIDWGKEVPETDVLFIVDWSGSMVDEIEAVLTALNQFAAYYSLEDKIHWGLIVGPRQLPGEFEERLTLVANISPFSDFLSSFAGLGSDGMSTGSEMLLDGIYLSLQNIASAAAIDMSSNTWDSDVGESIPPKDIFSINWRENADRVVIVFSDEEPQSYLIPKIDVSTVQGVCSSAPKTKVYTFSSPNMWEWDEIANVCDGEFFKLTNNATEMYASLMQILSEICQPEE